MSEAETNNSISALEQLCGSIRDGSVLLELLKTLVPRIAQLDKAKISNAEHNVTNFLELISDIVRVACVLCNLRVSSAHAVHRMGTSG